MLTFCQSAATVIVAIKAEKSENRSGGGQIVHSKRWRGQFIISCSMTHVRVEVNVTLRFYCGDCSMFCARYNVVSLRGQ